MDDVIRKRARHGTVTRVVSEEKLIFTEVNNNNNNNHFLFYFQEATGGVSGAQINQTPSEDSHSGNPSINAIHTIKPKAKISEGGENIRT